MVGDDETFEDLDEDQPVVVFIYDPYEREEFIYVVTELGQYLDREIDFAIDFSWSKTSKLLSAIFYRQPHRNRREGHCPP